jgi:trehalose-6-phosphate synthase
MPVRSDSPMASQGESVSVTPVGVDVGLSSKRPCTLPKPRPPRRKCRSAEELGDSKLILSVGRTDYTKGGIEQLSSFERVLEANPELLSARYG